MKKSLCILLALLVLLTACGCSSGGESAAAAKVLGNTEKLVEPDQLKAQSNNEPIGWQLEVPQKGEEIAVVTMSTGESFKLRFFPDEAPKAVYNFKRLALSGYYDGLTFHRIVDGFMVQGGDPEGTGTGGASVWGEKFDDEFNANLLNIDGAVAMANSGANTNGSQFFINCTGGAAVNWESYQRGFEAYQQDPDYFSSVYGRWIKMDIVADEMKKLYTDHGGNPHLDGYYSTMGLGHTVFAQVFEGMAVVEAISKTPVDESKNYRPLQEVVIAKVEIVEY